MFELALSNEELRFSLVNGSKSFVGRPGKISLKSFLSFLTSWDASRLALGKCEQNRRGSDLRLEREMGGGNWGDGAMDRGARRG